MASDAAPAISRHVDRLWPALRDLTESAAQVEKLVEHPGVQRVRDVIAAEVEALDRKLDRTALSSVEEYAHAHGRKGALHAFDEAITAILERAKAREQEALSNAEGESSAEG